MILPFRFLSESEVEVVALLVDGEGRDPGVHLVPRPTDPDLNVSRAYTIVFRS